MVKTIRHFPSLSRCSFVKCLVIITQKYISCDNKSVARYITRLQKKLFSFRFQPSVEHTQVRLRLVCVMFHADFFLPNDYLAIYFRFSARNFFSIPRMNFGDEKCAQHVSRWSFDEETFQLMNDEWCHDCFSPRSSFHLITFRLVRWWNSLKQRRKRLLFLLARLFMLTQLPMRKRR